MNPDHVINVDLAEVTDKPQKGGYVHTLAWGDPVEVLNGPEIAAGQHAYVEIRGRKYEKQADGSVKPVDTKGYIRAPKGTPAKDLVVKRKDNRVLKVDFVDVQQGDASVVETPAGQILLIDGGDNQMFARYLAARFRDSSLAQPRKIDCILVTHGDADHFAGLTEIHKSEKHGTPWKRLFILPDRVYHNGIVKGPSKANGKDVPDSKLLGQTAKSGGKTYLTELHDDLLSLPQERLNKPFKEWCAALREYQKRVQPGVLRFTRLDPSTQKAFDFLKGGVKMEVLGPLTTSIQNKPALEFLGNPPKGPRLGHEALGLANGGFSGLSASHTINGHSVILRLKYGNIHVLFGGDLNDQAERALTVAHQQKKLDLRAEVFKVPHHGSHDFSAAFVQAVSPVVSIVSSGDESARKEYIHPRATLIGALGRYSRQTEPLIFVTELVAFFQMEGYVCPEFHRLDKKRMAVVKNGSAEIDKAAKKEFFAFSRAAFGITMIRTDGQRLLVFTNSGQTQLKEAYAYEVDKKGNAVPSAIRKA